ncbi:hypothetical protein ES702_04862 [subsurface metagenome]
MDSPSKKRNRFTPQPVKSIQLRDRDYTILTALFEYGMLTTSQIATLFFGTHKRACVRLRELFDAGTVHRIFRPVVVGSAEIVYALGKDGVSRLAKHLKIDRKQINESRLRFEDPKPLFLDHYLEINQFRVALCAGTKANDYKVKDWKYEADLKIKKAGELPKAVRVKDPEKAGRTIPVVPDGFFTLEVPDNRQHHFFLEVDRGTMEPARFRRKMLGYARYRMDKIYRQHLNISGFRVLTITDRVSSLLNATTQIRPQQFHLMYYFADIQDITPEALFTAIWKVPNDNQNKALFN